jgi:hypothetical protein
MKQMPQEHITTVLTALFAPTDAVTPQTNPIIVYGLVFVLMAALALGLWAARPFRRGLGQKPLTPRPDDADGLPWMPGGDIFGTDDDEPAQPTPALARAAPTYQPPYQPEPTYRPAPPYQPPPNYQPPPTYQPEPTYRPSAGAPQFSNPGPTAPPQSQPGAPRNPWSTGGQ